MAQAVNDLVPMDTNPGHLYRATGGAVDLRTGTRMRAIHILPVVCGLVILIAGPVAGQTIRGTLTDGTSGRAVDSASVRLLDRGGRVVATATTDRQGAWTFRGVGRGRIYSVRAQKVGYAIVEAPPFDFDSDSVAFDLVTRPQVVVLEGVSATALNYASFESRRERRLGHMLGPGTVDRRLAKIQPQTTTRFLLGLQPMISHGVRRSDLFIRGCKPSYMIDGKLYFPPLAPYPPIDIDSLVKPWEIRAVELYTDPQFIPIEFDIKFPPHRCRILVVVWTFRGVGWEP
jgi:hypothetical protein